jgi:hypothetical protein
MFHDLQGGIARDEDQVTGLEKKELDKLLEGDMVCRTTSDRFRSKMQTSKMR